MDKWEKLGYVAAIFNPIPTGFVAGYFLYTMRKYKKTGRNVLIISAVITSIALSLNFLLLMAS